MLFLKSMESNTCSIQSGWAFHAHFPSGAVLRWVWIRLKLWIYKCGISCHYACFVLNFYSFFFPLASLSPLHTPPFLSVCLSLTILAAVHCLDNIREKDRRVRKIGEGWDVLLPSQYLGSQWCVNWKSGEILIRGKRQNLRLQDLDIRNNTYRQNPVEM